MGRQYLDEVGLARVADKVKARLKVVSEMPSSADTGAVRLYIGETTASYTKGHIYEYDSGAWTDISPAGGETTQNAVLIVDALTDIEQPIPDETVACYNTKLWKYTATGETVKDKYSFTDGSGVTICIAPTSTLAVGDIVYDKTSSEPYTYYAIVTAVNDTNYALSTGEVVYVWGDLVAGMSFTTYGWVEAYTSDSSFDFTLIAPEFSESTTYVVGQVVTYSEGIYYCSTAHSAGSWSASDFTGLATLTELIEYLHDRDTIYISAATSTLYTVAKSAAVTMAKLTGKLPKYILGRCSGATYPYTVPHIQDGTIVLSISGSYTSTTKYNVTQTGFIIPSSSSSDPSTIPGSLTDTFINSDIVVCYHYYNNNNGTISDFGYMKLLGVMTKADIGLLTGGIEGRFVNVSGIAQSAYSIGDYFIFNLKLVKATAAIAVSDTIAVGTNCEEVTVCDELNSKQDTLTFDTTPTSGSTNPVTSGGVYSYIDTMITQALSAGY